MRSEFVRLETDIFSDDKYSNVLTSHQLIS